MISIVGLLVYQCLVSMSVQIISSMCELLEVFSILMVFVTDGVAELSGPLYVTTDTE